MFLKDILHLRMQEGWVFVVPPRQAISGCAKGGTHTWQIRSGYWPITLKWKLCCQLLRHNSIKSSIVNAKISLFFSLSRQTHLTHTHTPVPKRLPPTKQSSTYHGLYSFDNWIDSVFFTVSVIYWQATKIGTTIESRIIALPRPGFRQ